MTTQNKSTAVGGESCLDTPVVFLVFNRPKFTGRILEAIRLARPKRLLVVADGPRPARLGEHALCAEVRRIVDTGVDWPCKVEKNYSEENLGCGRRVSSGLDWVFELVEEAIILEDDCLPHPTFFPFCAELLERYRSDERVAQIAGCSFLPEDGAGEESYFFSRYPHCWGWATWRRAWGHYDHDMRDWSAEREATWKIAPERPAERRLWSECFDRAKLGELDSWAYRWTSAVWARGMWSANSRLNLISNLGFGDEATHTTSGRWGNLPVHSSRFPLIHPVEMAQDVRADALIGRLVFEPFPFWRRLMGLARRLFRV